VQVASTIAVTTRCLAAILFQASLRVRAWAPLSNRTGEAGRRVGGDRRWGHGTRRAWSTSSVATAGRQPDRSVPVRLRRFRRRRSCSPTIPTTRCALFVRHCLRARVCVGPMALAHARRRSESRTPSSPTRSSGSQGRIVPRSWPCCQWSRCVPLTNKRACLSVEDSTRQSVVRAMDAVTAFADAELHYNITQFGISGGSKRGWTTWLTGAQRKTENGEVAVSLCVSHRECVYATVTWLRRRSRRCPRGGDHAGRVRHAALRVQCRTHVPGANTSPRGGSSRSAQAYGNW
jgi:hypothetical protein